MAQLIQLKRSAVAGRVPTTANLALGELAINVRDGKLYFQRDDSTIQTILTTNSTVTGDVNLVGTVTATAFVGDGSGLTGIAVSPTLQEVTDNGASTTNGITVASLTTAGPVEGSLFRDADDNNYFVNPSGATSAVLSGNVGIGVGSPAAKLEVNGIVRISGTNKLEWNNANVHITRDGNAMFIASYDGWKFYDMQGTTERVRITQTGNVGIGTTTPGSPLEVYGSGSTVLDIQGSQGQLFSVSDSLTGSLMSVNDISGLPILEVFDNDKVVMGEYGNNTLVVSGSKVGIGTDAPSTELEVIGTATVQSILPSTDSIYNLGSSSNRFLYTYSRYLDSGVNTLELRSGATMLFKNGGTERMRIDSAGNVGIGVTSPLAKLDIDGGSSKPLKLTTTNNDAIEFRGASASSTPFTFIGYNSRGFRFWDSVNAELFKIANDGDITLPKYGSGTFTGTPAYALAVDANGNIIENAVQSTPTGGSGTTNYVTKWTASDTVGNSVIYDNGSNVGIGTTSPVQKLDVSGNAQVQGILYVTKSGENSRFNSADANGAYISFRNNGTAKGYIGSGFHLWSSPNNLADNFGIRAENQLDFGIGASVKMTLNSSGNVGIGTTSPAYKLDVNGSVGITGDLEFTKVDGIQIKAKESMIFTIDSDDNDTGRIFQFKDGGGDTLMRIGDDGNVGIGTVSPSVQLDIEDSGNVIVDLNTTSANANTTIRFQEAGSVKATMGYEGTSDVVLIANGGFTAGNGINIDGSNNIGIGTATPNALFNIYGNNTSVLPLLRIENDGSGDAALALVSTGELGWSIGLDNSDSNKLKISTDAGSVSSNTKLTVDTSGNVGIGTTAPVSKLHVYGGGNTTFEGPAATDIDIRYRSNGVNKYNMFYQASTDGWGLYHNPSSSYRIFVDGSGDIGIGTNTPGSTLDIGGVFQFSTTSDLLQINNSTNTGGINLSGANSRIYFGGNRAIEGAQDGSNLILGEGYNSVQVHPNATFTVQGNQTLGGNLTVSGRADFQKDLRLRGSDSTGNLGVVRMTVDANNALTIDAGNDGANRILISQAGDLTVPGTITAQEFRAEFITNTIILESGSTQFGDSADDTHTFTGKAYFSENVGIGTNSPVPKLQLVYDGGTYSTDATSGFINQANTGRATLRQRSIEDAPAEIFFDVNGAARWDISVRDSGNDYEMMFFPQAATPAYNSVGDHVLALKQDGTVRLNQYGAGVLVTDANGNISADNLNFPTQANNDARYVNVTGDTMTGKLIVGQGIEYTGGSIAQATTVLHTNNVVYTRGGSAGLMLQNSDGSESVFIGNDHIRLETSSTERIRIDSTGKVGIGTSTPGFLLDVAGNAAITGGNRLWFKTGSDIGLENAAGTNAIYIANTGTTGSTLDIGTGTMVVVEGGSIGMGTTSPSSVNKLEVHGQSRVYGTMMIGNSATSNPTATNVTLHVKNSAAGARIRIEDSDNNNRSYDLYVNEGSGFSIIEEATTRMFFQESTGNVGIGTTSPSSKLHVVGASISATNGDEVTLANVRGARHNLEFKHLRTADEADWNSTIYRLQNKVDTTNMQSIDFTTDASYNRHIDINTASNAFNTRFTHNGRVGIGTTNPADRLSVQDGAITSTDASGINYAKIDRFSGVTLAGNGTGSRGVQTPNTDALTFGTNAIERMRITSAGNIGIGTTSPNSWAQLETTGTVAVGGILYIKSSQKIQGLTAFPGGAGNLSINPDGGNVGIGTTNPTQKLTVNGTIRGTGSTARLTLDNTSGQAFQIYAWGSGTNIYNSATSNAEIWFGRDATVANNFYFTRNGTNHTMKIDTANERVGIGTMSPTEKLHVAGNVAIEGTAKVVQTANEVTGDPAGTRMEIFSSAYIGAFIDYTIFDSGKNHMRSGTIQMVFDGNGGAQFTDNSTLDIGDTSPAYFDVVATPPNTEIKFFAPDPDWSVRYHVRYL